MVDMVQWSRNERSDQVVQSGKTRGTGRFVEDVYKRQAVDCHRGVVKFCRIRAVAYADLNF